MASKSAFLPRLSLGGTNEPPLPAYPPSSARHLKSPNGTFLTELFPRAEGRILDSDFECATQSSRRSPPPPPARCTASSDGYPSRTLGSAFEPAQPRVLFAGPPPPIAVSKILHRDRTDGERSPKGMGGGGGGGGIRSTLARSALGSVLFDRSRGSSPASDGAGSQAGRGAFEPDVAWRSLQRREKALGRELQHLLDAQSAGLAANLGDGETAGEVEDGSRSDTPTGTVSNTHWSAPASEYHRPHQYHDDHDSSQTAEVIPVRQPRPRPLGLRAARTGLVRAMMQLADLKADETAGLVGHVDARKRALAQLLRCSARRDSIAGELAALENNEGGGDPLTRELAELEREKAEVDDEIADLEARLVGLRNRRRWLVERTEDVRNRREAGLSGYRGALKEAEARIDVLLRKPPVQPLDVEAIVGASPDGLEEAGQAGGANGHDQSPGGAEFLSMRPERRTVAMAKEWWESEVAILERRKAQVDMNRTALEEGMKVWKDAIALVTDFETGLCNDLRGETRADSEPRDKGKAKALTPEEAMYAQLSKMQPVLDGLARLLQTAEDKGWNLLICAIGAELAAFQQGEAMLRDALRTTGHGHNADEDGRDDGKPQDDEDDHDEGDTTPPVRSWIARGGPPTDGTSAEPSLDQLVDLRDDDAGLESDHDNDVPADLLVSPHDSREDHGAAAPDDGQGRAAVHHMTVTARTRCLPSSLGCSEHEPDDYLVR